MSAAPAAEKAKAKAKPAEHPKYIDMAIAAVTALKERSGSSRQAILKYIVANYKVSESANTHLKQALKRGVTAGALKQVKGAGASGSFKVAEKPKPAKKAVAKKPAAKKPAAKKPAAKVAKKSPKKKAAAKKPAAKKATPKKKPAAKKPAAKKPAAKKPAAKKTPKKAAKKKTPKKAKK